MPDQIKSLDLEFASKCLQVLVERYSQEYGSTPSELDIQITLGAIVGCTAKMIQTAGEGLECQETTAVVTFISDVATNVAGIVQLSRRD